MYVEKYIQWDGIQRCRSQFGSIFTRLAVVASTICEIQGNSPKNHSSSRSSKVIDLGANRKAYTTSSSNFGPLDVSFSLPNSK